MKKKVNDYQELTEVPFCPICERKDRICVYSSPKYTEEENKHIVSCINCHMNYVSPLIMEKYEEHEERSIFDHINCPGFIFLARHFELYLQSYGLLKPEFQKNLLEIGCGTGHLLNVFRARGWHVTGIEIWKSHADWGIKHLGLDIKKNYNDIFTLPDNFYDGIVLVEVIEHLADPVGVLNTCYAKLKDKGGIFVTTPNFGSKIREKLGWGWDTIDPLGHIQYFTINTLSLAVKKANFSLIDIKTAGGDTGDVQLLMCAIKDENSRVDNQILMNRKLRFSI